MPPLDKTGQSANVNKQPRPAVSYPNTLAPIGRPVHPTDNKALAVVYETIYSSTAKNVVPYMATTEIDKNKSDE